MPLYSDPHCEIRMTTVRPDGDGTYEVYFLATNHLEEGIYFTAPERCLDEAGNRRSEFTGRIEMETDQGWLPCFWGAPGGFNEVNEWGIQLCDLEYSESVPRRKTGRSGKRIRCSGRWETGQVTLRFQGIWQNHWQLKGRAVEEAPLPLHRGPRPWETELPA